MGVLVGGGIVFLTTCSFDYLKTRREKKNLRAGIPSEVRVAKEIFEKNVKATQNWKKQIAKQGLTEDIKIAGELKLSFIERNLDKLGILDENLLRNVIQLYTTNSVIPDHLKLLEAVTYKVYRGREKPETFTLLLLGMEATYRGLIELSDRIINSP